MAEHNIGGSFQSPYRPAPSPSALSPRDPETITPLNYYTWHYEPQSYQQFQGHHRPPLPEPYIHGYYSGRSPYPYTGYTGSRTPGLFGPTTGMFQHHHLPPMPSTMTPRHFGLNLHVQDSTNPDFSDLRAMNSPLEVDTTMQQSSMSQNAMPGMSTAWNSPSYDFHHHVNLSNPPVMSRPSQNSNHAMRPTSTNGEPSVRVNSTNVQLSPHMISPSQGQSYQRSQQSSSLVSGTPERSSTLHVPTSRRPDRSISPRTSHRRSFDRYSTDLSQSSGTPESDDANHTPSHRSRRPRTAVGGRVRMPGFQARLLAQCDPNVPSPGQMQLLKEKLKKLVRSELAEDVSPTCDICQKDYSEKLVEPTETEEVAVELPCKHVFGEHCIHTWAETCKTHKNKVTCPMCRTLLVRPIDRRQELFEMLAARGNAGLQSYVQGEHRRLMAEFGGRELEGDFAHA